MTEQAFRDILKRYEEGTCSHEERLMVEAWFAYRTHSADFGWQDREDRETTRDSLFDRIVTIAFPVSGLRAMRGKMRLIAVAASFILAAGGWLAYQKLHVARVAGNTASFHNKQSDWAGPGSRIALLTLSDGKTVRLDELEKKQAFEDDGVVIASDKAGHLTYTQQDAGNKNARETVLWNTIAIPYGSQYKVSLPDGTVVWLNSASSLKYPTHFTGNKRSVILNGEAYFDVAKKSKCPFVVETGFTRVEATGTAFNLKAYADEQQVQTTLLEGGVNVKTDHAVVHLKPGQQAVSSVNDNAIATHTVELGNAVAWREGFFVFDDQDIRSIMKSLERWYHMEVVFRGSPSSQKFGGTFTMGKDVTELLRYLEQISHLSFNIEGRRIIVANRI